MDIKKYLIDRLEDQKNWYGNKANFNKKRFMNYQMIVIILGASIPVLVILFEVIGWRQFQGIASATISAIITAVAGIDKLQNPQTSWYNYRANEEKLKKEKHLYEFKVGQYNGLSQAEADKALVENVENIISVENTSFVRNQKSLKEERESEEKENEEETKDEKRDKQNEHNTGNES